MVLTARLAQAQQEPPKVLVHYMPWYQTPEVSGYWGWHWTMNHFDPEQVGADGQRAIASQHYPSIGPYDSSDPDVLEYHTLLMTVAGIDGVIVDWYGTSSLFDYPVLNEASKALFGAIEAADLLFAVCYEDATLARLIENGRIADGDAIAQAQADFQFVRDEWTTSPAYLTHNGQPVIFNFGPQHLNTSAEWASALSVFSEPPVLINQDRRVAPAGSGGFPWPPMWASTDGVLTPAQLLQYLNNFYSQARFWPVTVGSAFPGFHDIYEEAGVRESYGYLDPRDGDILRVTFDQAVGQEVPMIQLVTWNDFGEGTTIEPTVEYGTQYLQFIQSRVQGWRDLPFVAEDLRLPEQIFRARKDYAGDATVQAEADAAAEALRTGDPTTARALLNAAALSDEPVAERSFHISLRPNPANGHAAVRVDLDAPQHLRAEAYDVLGRRVHTFADAWHPAGRHDFAWSLDEPSGVYVIRVTAGDAVQTRLLTVRR
ncbi:MAG: T9SS type A sorting domain-containing protein [Bacteroidota bacterium]